MLAIEKLKEFVSALPDGNRSIQNVSVQNLIELELKDGFGYSFGIYKNEHVAVAKTVVSKGSVFMPHYHRESEIITIYEGSLDLFIGAVKVEDLKSIEPITLLVGESYRIEPNTPHVGVALEDTRMIVITIPASKYFPDGCKKDDKHN